MKYALFLCLVLPLVALADKPSFGIQRFNDPETCKEVVDTHNKSKEKYEFHKIRLKVNDNVCLAITLDGTASTEEQAIERFEKDFLDKGSMWRVERNDRTYIWRLVPK